MKTAIILHGMPSKEEYFSPDGSSQSNKHWLPWIQKELTLNGILAQTPELPEPYDPVYEKWASVFEQFAINEGTTLIGHSCGGGFLVRWLSENKVKVGKVVLVAPFLDPDHDEVKSNFFDFEIDENMAERTQGIFMIFSVDDDCEILDSVNQIRSKVKNIQIIELLQGGHFTMNDMKTEEFPELRDILLK